MFFSVEDELMLYGFLSVCELFVYELLKFVLNSNNNLHIKKYLNNLFVFSNSLLNTCNCCRNVLKHNARKVKIQRYSIHSSCVKLFDNLQHNNFFNNDVCS